MSENVYSPRSTLFSYLPGIFQDAEEYEQQSLQLMELLQEPEPRPRRPFLDYYLLPFEKLLFAGDSGLNIAGLDAEISGITSLFIARSAEGTQTREDFLPWLAGWGAFVLRADLSEDRKRQIVERIISLYPLRGTRKYLRTVLKWTLDVEADVIDRFPSFRVGQRSTVGVDSFLGGAPAHYFRVVLRFRDISREGQARQLGIAREVIELARPAHTIYDLQAHHPRMQINKVSTIGVDTFL